MTTPLYLNGVTERDWPDWDNWVERQFEYQPCRYCGLPIRLRLLPGVPGHGEVAPHGRQIDDEDPCPTSWNTIRIEQEQERLI